MRLSLLDLGPLDLDRQVLMPGSAPGARRLVPVPAYLIQADDGTMVLVDTGMSREFLRGDIELGDRIRRAGGTFITDRLTELGLRPEEITYVVATHFHFDHAGGLLAFPASTIVAQRAAVEAARRGNERERAIATAPGVRWQLVEGDVDLVPGVRLLATAGHAPGHQSVLVTTARDGAFLLAIDAIYTSEQLAADDWGAYVDPDAARASARKVQALAAATGATLVYGHDPEQWRALRHVPAWYE